jgi:hypothetical protein
MGWQLWLILSSFLAGYCVGETVHLVQEIRTYRSKKEKPCLPTVLLCELPDTLAYAVTLEDRRTPRR